jgi:SAM-dependent methyltransferase
MPGTPSATVTEQTVVNRTRVILQQLNEQPAEISLDAGCGLGVYLPSLSLHSRKVVGIDIIREHLNQAGSNAYKGNAQVACMSLEHIGLRDATFDFIICIETLEHVTNDESAVKELRRLLKPGGRIVISVPYKWFPFETHGVCIGSRITSSPFGLGFPFLPFLPPSFRRRFATVRVYSACQLKKLLGKNNIYSKEVLFLMPGLDIFEKKTSLKFLTQLLRNGLECLQRRLSGVWGSTIVIIGQAY